jgi:tetratricopeptide (TPR) repeat protein
VEAWMNKANALFESGQREEGLQAALRAIEVSPVFARTWLNKGAMERRMGRSALALASFREYLRLGTSEPAKHLAEARRATRELEAEGKKPAPRSAHAFLTQASQLLAERQFVQALEALDRALALLPGLGTALLLKGDAFAEMRQPRTSMAYYEQGLQADPGDPRLWNAKGAALTRQGHHDQALACFDEALRLDPRSSTARSGRGWALLQAGRSAQALAAFDDVLAQESKDSLALFGKACAQDQLGRTVEAARSYRKFVGRAEPALAPQVEHAKARLRSLKA